MPNITIPPHIDGGVAYNTPGALDAFGIPVKSCHAYAAYRPHANGVPIATGSFATGWTSGDYRFNLALLATHSGAQLRATAALIGARVDDVPAVGALAVWVPGDSVSMDGGPPCVQGHPGQVGYIAKVISNDQVVIQHYNADVMGGYSEAVVDPPRVLHFPSSAPAPAPAPAPGPAPAPAPRPAPTPPATISALTGAKLVPAGFSARVKANRDGVILAELEGRRSFDLPGKRVRANRLESLRWDRPRAFAPAPTS